jgi:hypothetical protein
VAPDGYVVGAACSLNSRGVHNRLVVATIPSSVDFRQARSAQQGQESRTEEALAEENPE